MKLETCVYSGYKIHPGHGRRMVRADGKIQIFLSKKCSRATRLKRNPRDVPWTVLYRRKHKKGVHAEEGAQKKRVKRVGAQATARPIAGMGVDQLLERRNQRPEFRRAQREQAVKAAKEAVRAQRVEKERQKEKTKKPAAQKVKPVKQVKQAVGRVGGKR